MGSELKREFLAWRQWTKEIFVLTQNIGKVVLRKLDCHELKNFPFLTTSGDRKRIGRDFKSGFSSVAAWERSNHRFCLQKHS